MKRGRGKALYRRERRFKGAHEEAEIQREALRRRKNLAYSKDTCLEKKLVWSKVTSRKVGVRMRELNKRKIESNEQSKEGGQPK